MSGTTASCDGPALAQFLAGQLADEQRAAVLAHAQGCPECAARLAALRRVDRLLGPIREPHPAAALLVAFADGQLAAGARATMAAHLVSCAECALLARAADAGLAEAAKLERGLDLLAARAAAPTDHASLPAVSHRVIEIPAGPPPRALAATAALAPAPAPEDRRLLVEDPGRLRIVFHREGGEGLLTLFALGLAPIERPTCTLEDRPVQPVALDDAWLFHLGATGALGGCTLRVALTVTGQVHGYSFTLVEE